MSRIIKYLLSIEEFLEPDAGRILEEAFSKVDPDRRRKAGNLKPGRAQAACLGAGLLLQLAAREFLQSGHEIAQSGEGLTRYTASGLLRCLRDKPPLPLALRYGEKGKPYFRDYPIYFNLSHSGDYVLCALSPEEVGADIQQHRAGARGQIAARFFSPREIAALAGGRECDNELFFRLWTRKEAYGKLTGEGIAKAVGTNLLPEEYGTGINAFPSDTEMSISEIAFRRLQETQTQDGREFAWEEYRIPGYSISLCVYCKSSHA